MEKVSKYTTELRHIVESGYPIFDFDYPIFDENYRGVLQQKIIDTYYFREIGFETVGMFKHYLKTKLNNIMPYYNQLYETEGLVNKENYNINLDNTITQKRTTEGNSESNSSSNGLSKNRDVFSDTPQAKLKDLDYATNLTENDGESENHASGKTTAKTIDEYEEHLLGNGSMRYNADILMEWRKSFLNIDQDILKELNDLFMNVY